MNLFIWLSKNWFIIVALIENRFMNHKKVHVYEPFLAGVKQLCLIGSQNRFIIYGLFYKRTTKKSVHKKYHNYEQIVKNWFTNDVFLCKRFTNEFSIECIDTPLRRVPGRCQCRNLCRLCQLGCPHGKTRIDKKSFLSAHEHLNFRFHAHQKDG